MNQRPNLTIFLIGVIAFGLVFMAAPWFAFRALRSAAKSNDIQAMSELIDFNAVRTNLNGQVNPEAAATAPDIWLDQVTNDDGRKTLFSFERRGLLDWKLVQIHLPGKPAPDQKPQS